MNIDNLPNLWLAMHGCAEADPASFPRHVSVTESLLRKSTGGTLPSRPLPVARFGHARPLAKDSGRHLLGTRLPGHTSVTPGFLQKSTGGTFWARGFKGTLWSRRASRRRARSAPFGHELLSLTKQPET